MTLWSATNPGSTALRFAFSVTAARRKKLRRMSSSRCIGASISCNRRSICWPGCGGSPFIGRPMPIDAVPAGWISRRMNFVRSTCDLDGTGSAISKSVFESPAMTTHIEQMVASLPPAQRAVVLLRYQEDMMPTEISALLSMPLGTVKSHLQRALKLLRTKASQQRKEVVHG